MADHRVGSKGHASTAGSEQRETLITPVIPGFVLDVTALFDR